MFVKMDIDINDLDNLLWSGARQKWDGATDAQKEAVWDSVEAAFGDETPEMVELNDFIWYDCDEIFFPEEEEKDEARCRRIERKRPVMRKRPKARPMMRKSNIDHI